jgi:hypothetical protein
MKTINILTAAALVAMNLTSLGQPVPSNGYVLNMKSFEYEIHAASLTAGGNRFENWMGELQSRISGNNIEMIEAPIVVWERFTLQAEVIHEGEYEMEGWMSAPFESDQAETVLPMEQWMSNPFELEEIEEELQIESWMVEPFESEEQIALERWMKESFLG